MINRQSTAVFSAALLLVLTGCGSTPALNEVSVANPGAAVSEPQQEPIRIAVVGDSISTTTDRAGLPVDVMWPAFAQDAQVTLVGGWAKEGAQMAEMEANVTPVDADVLVVMAGTNDLTINWGAPIPQRLAYLDSIVAKVGADKVLISTVAPFRNNMPAGLEWNAVLEKTAAVKGWEFIDPWTELRTSKGDWVAGTDMSDRATGVHPNAASSKIVGLAIRGKLASLR